MGEEPPEIDSDRSPSVPTTPLKTNGRKKIKIQRIEDSRNRQVTFLKRKNGLLKKAMELGILCDCEVNVVIFNLNNGKLFEYSSVEPEKVLQKYATYSGPSERRRKEKFFDLAASKGHSNIPLNEPQLAQAAMDAANAASRRPRPVHKFKNSDSAPVADQYYNGRKLSSGESPGNLPLSLTPSTENAAELQQKLTPSVAVPLSSSVETHIPAADYSTQNQPPQQLRSARGPSPHTQLTPRFTAEVQFPPMFTPHTASRHLSAAFGLQTPTTISARDQDSRLPFGQPVPGTQEPPVSAQFAAPPPQSARRFVNIAPKASNAARPPVAPPQVTNQTTTLPSAGTVPAPPSSAPRSNIVTELRPRPDPRAVATARENADNQHEKDGNTLEEQAATSQPQHGAQTANSAEHKAENAEATIPVPYSEPKTDGQQNNGTERPATKSKPNLTVFIPHPNRDDGVGETPSGLNSSSSPSSRNEPLPSLGSARFPGMSPTGSMWMSWNPLATGDREAGHVPLTPFLNMDAFGMTPDASAFGAGSHFSLPSPTNAGLIPLTPRILGFDPLVTARGDAPSTAAPPPPAPPPPLVPRKRSIEEVMGETKGENGEQIVKRGA